MHRIMADLMSKDFEVVTRPSEENYTMQVPEGNAANTGRIGVQGCHRRIYHPFSLTLKTTNDGQIINFIENNSWGDDLEVGAKFSIEPTALTDYAETDVVDALNPLGADNEHTIGRYRFIRAALVDGANYYRIRSPKVAPLALADNIDDEYNYVAMALWIENHSTTNNFWFSIMANKRRDASAADVTWPYIWREPFSSTVAGPSSLVYTVSDAPIAADMVEFDDGTIFLVAAFYDSGDAISQLQCFRSFDYGTTWNFCGYAAYETTDTYAQSVALERVNERLIVAYQYCCDDGANTDIHTDTWYSDDFGATWTQGDSMSSTTVLGVRSGVKPCVDLCRGRDGILYGGFTYYGNALSSAYTYFMSTLDGANWTQSTLGGYPWLYNFGLVESASGGWFVFGQNMDVGNADDFELSVWSNPLNPMEDEWWQGSANSQRDLTYNSVAANVAWDFVAAAQIENQTFFCVLASMYDSASNSVWKSTIGEIKCGMWSGITPRTISPAASIYSAWDYTWSSCCYPSTSDSEPNIHSFTRSTAGDGSSTLTNDAVENRSYLRCWRSAGANSILYRVAAVDKKAEGGEIRVSLRVYGGNGVISIRTSEAVGDGISVDIVFIQNTNQVIIYDNYKGGGAGVVDTCNPSNWAVYNWNTYHIIWQNEEIYVYRATDQFAEILNFELIASCDSLGVGAIPATEAIYFGAMAVGAYDNATNADFECVMINTTGIQWSSLPVDQDTDLIWRRAYFYPQGLYAGMCVKFDGHYSIDGDTWDVETSAVYAIENIFTPSPAACWKSAQAASDPLGTEPNEVFTWKQTDSDGQMHQTVTGFAVFGRNWPFCKLEGSEDGAAWTTIFDSLATKSLSYAIRLEANGASHYNQVIAALPVGMPALHTNRFASTPEMNWYLMAIEGDEMYRVYRILESDMDRFYLDRAMAVGLDDGEDFFVFSDRFYYDFSIRATESSLWGDVYGDTSYAPTQYRYFRLTVYGNDGGGNNIIFPDADEGLKRIGSLHLGRVYDLPNEEWGVTVATQPMMSVTESRSGRKEYRRVGVARRMIGLGYTGVIERGLCVNPVVDLNRSLGWGEHPLVFVDDADLLHYGDASSYGSYTHPNPVLCRMVDGYQMSRAAYSLESEHNGGEAVELTRNVVDVSGLRLEEVV